MFLVSFSCEEEKEKQGGRRLVGGRKLGLGVALALLIADISSWYNNSCYWLLLRAIGIALDTIQYWLLAYNKYLVWPGIELLNRSSKLIVRQQRQSRKLYSHKIILHITSNILHHDSSTDIVAIII